MELVVCADSVTFGQRAADVLLDRLVGRSNPVLGVATGSSPLALYSELSSRVAAGQVDLSAASAFALDEYVGIPVGHPESYAEVVRRTVVEPLGLASERVQVPQGGAADLAAAARQYELDIAAAGGVDVQILGIGSNGHIGFNEPGSTFESRTRVVELAAQTRADNARFFPSIDDVPTSAMTQGLATIMSARAIVLVATGAKKAAAIAAALEGPITTDCPASVLQRHPDVTLIVDESAASLVTR